MNLQNLPQEIKSLKQWVCTKGDSKVPICFETGQPASSVDPLTWGDYECAEALHKEYPYYELGFVFNRNGIVGIDIDDGFDEDGFVSPRAADIINKCKSYTEKSRSGTGFHILVKGNLPFSGKNNLKGVEIYQEARYFIMTGDTLLYKNIIENQEAIDYVLEKHFVASNEKTTSGDLNIWENRIYNPEWIVSKNGKIRLRPVYPRIPDGCRNICLTSLGGMLHNQGYSKEQIYDELLYCNKVACEPLLPDREIKTIVNSVTRYKR